MSWCLLPQAFVVMLSVVMLYRNCCCYSECVIFLSCCVSLWWVLSYVMLSVVVPLNAHTYKPIYSMWKFLIFNSFNFPFYAITQGHLGQYSKHFIFFVTYEWDPLSWSVCPRQAFTAWFNVTLQLINPICKLRSIWRVVKIAPEAVFTTLQFLSIFWRLQTSWSFCHWIVFLA